MMQDNLKCLFFCEISDDYSKMLNLALMICFKWPSTNVLFYQWPANHSVDVDRRIYVSWNCGDANDKVNKLHPTVRIDVFFPFIYNVRWKAMLIVEFYGWKMLLLYIILCFKGAKSFFKTFFFQTLRDLVSQESWYFSPNMCWILRLKNVPFGRYLWKCAWLW